MCSWKLKKTAPLLVPLFLMSAALFAATAPPAGRVIGLAPTQSSHVNSHSAIQLAAQPAATGCSVYFDATGQLTFQPPAADTALNPAIGSANIFPTGPAFAHGTQATTATASGHALTANVGINSVTLTLPVSSIPLGQVSGLVYFATSTTCTASSFTTTVQSAPVGPTGEVLASLNANTSITASATYTTTETEQPQTYSCTGVTGQIGAVACNVWAVNVTFSFLPSTFSAGGAGAYSLNINQVSMSP